MKPGAEVDSGLEQKRALHSPSFGCQRTSTIWFRYSSASVACGCSYACCSSSGVMVISISTLRAASPSTIIVCSLGHLFYLLTCESVSARCVVPIPSPGRLEGSSTRRRNPWGVIYCGQQQTRATHLDEVH